MIKKTIRIKNNSLTVQISYNLINRPTFHSEERLVKLEEESALLVYIYMLLVYGVSPNTPTGGMYQFPRQRANSENLF